MGNRFQVRGDLWSVLWCTTVANRAFADTDDLVIAVRRASPGLRYRHDVLYGYLAGIGLRRVQHDDITH
ncbi:hypothetical protein KBZ10_08380 [Streptomyces sp. F63]|uniref:hypothetical protein n=1 Tax=Streptomyces sp. F63 TaxID=2824887 RepID=UPI001B377DDA|nr:hypothetical protein [Streptomyces sp. F63]MBQ0984535.1 hypothetical protein [Streptomyces sp. F63]